MGFKASGGPGAVPKMRVHPPIGTHFCFYRAYCVYQKSTVAVFLLQHSRFHKLHIKNLHFPKLRAPKNCGHCSTHSTP